MNDPTRPSMISEKCGLISVDVIPVEYEEILRVAEEHREQFARDIYNSTSVRGNYQPTATTITSIAASRRIENILAASPSGLWFKMTTLTCEPPLSHPHRVAPTTETNPSTTNTTTTTTTSADVDDYDAGSLSATTTSQLAAHVDQNVFDDDDVPPSSDNANSASTMKDDDALAKTATQFPTTTPANSLINPVTPVGSLSHAPPKTFVVYRSLDHLVWFQRQLLEKEPFLLVPELPVSVETAAEDPLRAIDQITSLISTLASTDATAADPLFWSIITQPDDDFFEMFRGMVYGGSFNSGDGRSSSEAGVGKASALASSLVGAFKRAKAKATGNTVGGFVDDNGVPVSGDRAKFGLCETASDALAQEIKSTRFSATDRKGLTSVVAPVSSSLDVADVWWECENSLTETNLLAGVAAASGSMAGASSGSMSPADASGRNLILTDNPMGYTIHQSQKDRLLESQLIRRQRRDDELVVLKKRFTEKLLEAVNTHLRLPDTETKPDNLSTMMLASCAIDRAFFSCDKLKEVIASSFFFQNELLRNDDMYFSWGESLVALYKLRVALDGLQEASHGASEAWKEFCGGHYWPYTREKVTEEELKPKLSPRVHTSNRLTHYTLRSANVLAQVSQTEKGIITEGFVSAVTTGAMLAAAHRWRCAVLHQHLHRGNSVMPSARLACGGWGVVAAGGGAAVVKVSTSTKLSDQYSHIPSGPGSVLATNHKSLSVGKPSTGLPAPFVANCQKLVTPASGKTGRNLFQLQRDLKKVCEEGNGVAELESLDAIDEDSSTIQDFLDISTGNFQQHCDEVNKQLLYPQLLSSMHEMVLYQKLSWQATEMVAKEFQRMIDEDLFLEALEEDLPFLDNSPSKKQPAPAKSSSNTKAKVVASGGSQPSAMTQFGSVTNLFRRRRAAQHEEEEGEEVWRARQERMAAERLHNTHGGQYQGDVTTYYTSSPVVDQHQYGENTKPRSTSLFTWKKQPSHHNGSHALGAPTGGGGEEMEDFEGGGPPPPPYGGNRNPSTLEAQEFRNQAIRAKVSGLGGYTGNSINDDFGYDENPFDVPASNSKRQSQKYQTSSSSPPAMRVGGGGARSMSPKFSVNDDDASSPWHRSSTATKTTNRSRGNDLKNRASMPVVEDEAVFASTYSSGVSGGKKNNKSSWKEREASLGATTTTTNLGLKKRNSNMDDPFGA